jgi:Tfp pilus assembly protein PilO
MMASLDKLNLRPQEKRLIVGVAVVIFVVLNIWFVWPHFSDWKTVRAGTERARKTVQTYKAEIARGPEYQKRLKDLEQEGASVVTEEMTLNLERTVEKLSVASGVTVTRRDPRLRAANSQTNQFFEEQTLNLKFITGNDELVKFLLSLASTNSLIRVQDLSLKPAAGGTRLDGDVTLVASYQKKIPTVPSPAASAAGAGRSVATNRTAKTGAAVTPSPVAAKPKPVTQTAPRK